MFSPECTCKMFVLPLDHIHIKVDWWFSWKQETRIHLYPCQIYLQWVPPCNESFHQRHGYTNTILYEENTFTVDKKYFLTFWLSQVQKLKYLVTKINIVCQSVKYFLKLYTYSHELENPSGYFTIGSFCPFRLVKSLLMVLSSIPQRPDVFPSSAADGHIVTSSCIVPVPDGHSLIDIWTVVPLGK